MHVLFTTRILAHRSRFCIQGIHAVLKTASQCASQEAVERPQLLHHLPLHQHPVLLLYHSLHLRRPHRQPRHPRLLPTVIQGLDPHQSQRTRTAQALS